MKLLFWVNILKIYMGCHNNLEVFVNDRVETCDNIRENSWHKFFQAKHSPSRFNLKEHWFHHPF
jgi:hypothetical protein